MLKSNQTPLTAMRGNSPHNFSQKFSDWEAAVFDNAAYYDVIGMRSPPRTHDEFLNFASAVEFARKQTHVCIYAITANGRSVLLDPQKWDEWIQREKELLS